MNEQNKGLLIFLSVIATLVLANAGWSFLLPLVVFGAVWYFFIRPKQPQFITPNNKTMNSFNFSNVKRTGLIVLVLVLAIILLANMVRVVPAGQTGVYHLFGNVRAEEVPSGIHLINPLASLVMMSIRTEQYTMSIATTEGQRFGDDSIEALTKEGLKVHLDMTVLYHLNEDMADEVYRELGTNYEEKLIRPQVRTAIRDVIALYEAKDIYSDKREEAVNLIKEKLVATVEPRGVEIESVLLRNVSLPQMLTAAIESKLTAEQESERYDFVLTREEKEAERKRIEAAGQRDSQTIINQSLSDRYLQYLYIQNLENREGTIYVPYDMPLFRGM